MSGPVHAGNIASGVKNAIIGQRCSDANQRCKDMMTSSNGNIFRVTGHLCGEFTSDADLWCFFDLRLNKRLNKQSWGWWFETPSRSLSRHCNAIHALHLIKHAPSSALQCFVWFMLLVLNELSSDDSEASCHYLSYSDWRRKWGIYSRSIKQQQIPTNVHHCA